MEQLQVQLLKVLYLQFMLVYYPFLKLNYVSVSLDTVIVLGEECEVEAKVVITSHIVR